MESTKVANCRDAESEVRILFVDDEANILRGIHPLLRRRRPEWEVECVTSGEHGLTALDACPFQIVVSDMRMPGMDGAEFLRAARDKSPDTIRMLLTGHTDLDAALKAVNEGYIFRFLSKPCPPPILIQALDDALEQYRMVTGDRLLLERKLEEMTEELLRAERLASLGTLASGVGHELGNIAQVFMAELAFVQESAARGQPAGESELQSLGQVARHLREHSQHLRDLGRPGGTENEVLDLHDSIRATLQMLRAVGRIKQVRVDVSHPREPVYVHANRTRLEQVLVNLINNASYAAAAARGAKGKVDVILERTEEPQGACIRVEDNGVGIPADKLTDIFEPYFTTKPAGEGTGLGLPVVRQIVESYEGNIDVESTEGVGTTFAVRLPLAAEPETPPRRFVEIAEG